MPSGTFTARALRSQGWWAIEVTGDRLPFPAYTQARRLGQAEAMVRDLLALHFDLDVDHTGDIELVPVLDGRLDDEI
jgi:hypothetical protein